MVVESQQQVAPSKDEMSASEARIKAMAHPLRRAILMHFIEQGVKSPKEVAVEMRKELGVVSHHIRLLHEWKCLELVREEPVRGSTKHYYVATERHIVEADEFETLDLLEREAMLGDFMQPLLRDFTKSIKDGVLGSDGRFHITRIPIKALDQEGFDELLNAHRLLMEQTTEITRRAAERMAKSGEAPIKVSSGQTCFEVEDF